MACRSPFYLDHMPEIPIPCGKCPQCLMRKTSAWSFRIMEENKVSKSAYFITLTYDNEHVPIIGNRLSLSPMINNIRIKNISKLWITPKKKLIKKKITKLFVHKSKSKSNDITNFFKKIRKYGEKVRFYGVGEYGSETWRPHYHFIIFNLNDIDNLFKAWNKGFIHIGEVEPASIQYTLKYISKGKKIPQYEGDPREKEQTYISNNIGKSFVNERTKKFLKGNIKKTYLTTDEGFKIPIPNYYKNLIYTEEERKEQSQYIRREMKTIELKDRKNWKKNIPYDEYNDLKRETEWHKHQKSINKKLKL